MYQEYDYFEQVRLSCMTRRGEQGPENVTVDTTRVVTWPATKIFLRRQTDD